jgi:hypothetical protein
VLSKEKKEVQNTETPEDIPQYNTQMRIQEAS